MVDWGVGDYGSCPWHQGRGHQREEGRAKITLICITRNMWLILNNQGHSLEILPRAPETIGPSLSVCVSVSIKSDFACYSQIWCKMLNCCSLHINVTSPFKTVCKNESGYIAQWKTKNQKRWSVNVLTRNITFLIFAVFVVRCSHCRSYKPF